MTTLERMSALHVSPGSGLRRIQAMDRATLSDQVAVHIARAIVGRSLTPGDALASEQELAAAYNVSKPTIRVAARALAGLGLVRAQQGKRTLVQDESQWNVFDPLVHECFELEGRADELAAQLYDMRLILETSSASRAAVRATAEQIAYLRVQIERMHEIAAAEPSNLDEFLRIDREFHDLVAQASGNGALRQVIRQVNGDLATAWSSSSITDDELEGLADLHDGITDAISGRDPELAAARMQKHLERAASKAVEVAR